MISTFTGSSGRVGVWFILWIAALHPACRATADGAAQPASPSAEARIEQRFPEAFSVCHYGLYLFGEKAGFVRTETRRDPLTDEIHQEFTLELEIMVEDAISRSSMSSRKIYASERPHPLLFEEDVSTHDGSEERMVFNARGPIGRVGVFAGGTSHVREGCASKESFAAGLEVMEEVSHGAVGGKGRIAEFDMDRQGDQMKTLEFLGVETIELDGVELELRHLQGVRDDSNDAEDVFLDAKGIGVLIRLGEAMEARLEEAEVARSHLAPVDMLTAGSVPLEDFQGDPTALGRLELEWSGTSRLLPTRAGQESHWKIEGERQLVQLNRLEAPTQSEREASIPEDIRRELGPDSLCNSDHPRIRDLAAEIVGEERDPWKRVQLVVHWIDQNIEGAYRANHETALAVLDARRGDCTEFTALASGLLRAAGIPTRRVGGVALVADAPQVLHGHAWVEVWIGEWFAIDPTFGQVPADCGHICFGGEKDFDFFGVRSMRARVVASTKRGQ